MYCRCILLCVPWLDGLGKIIMHAMQHAVQWKHFHAMHFWMRIYPDCIEWLLESDDVLCDVAPMNASCSERCDFISPFSNVNVLYSIYKCSACLCGSRAHKLRDLSLSRPRVWRSYIQGSGRESVIATTLVWGNTKSFHVKAVSALILTVSEIRSDSTVPVWKTRPILFDSIKHYTNVKTCAQGEREELLSKSKQS